MKVDSIYALINFENSIYSYNTTLNLIKTDPIALIALNVYGQKLFRVHAFIRTPDFWVHKVSTSYSEEVSVCTCTSKFPHTTDTDKKIWHLLRYKNTYYRLNVKSNIKIIELYHLLECTLN